jgi:hypothetical protein
VFAYFGRTILARTESVDVISSITYQPHHASFDSLMHDATHQSNQPSASKLIIPFSRSVLQSIISFDKHIND